ncbi:hypothetical protein D3C80_1875320 [compost metagenome]
MVVPVLEAHEGTLRAVLQIEFGQALEHRGNGVAFLEIEPVVVAVVGNACAVTADAQSIAACYQLRVRILRRPAGAQGQGGIAGQIPVVVQIPSRGLHRCACVDRQCHAGCDEAWTESAVFMG